MAAKLSKAQTEVVDLKRNGWQLSTSVGYHDTYSWLRYKDGRTKNISSATVRTLYRKDVIYIAEEKFPVRVFRLKTAYK